MISWVLLNKTTTPTTNTRSSDRSHHHDNNNTSRSSYYDDDEEDGKDVKDDDKDVISTNILGDFDRKKFHHNNIREIEHIRNMDNISLDDAIDLHYDALQAIKSVFG